jgi:hypothetical protein
MTGWADHEASDDHPEEEAVWLLTPLGLAELEPVAED